MIAIMVKYAQKLDKELSDAMGEGEDKVREVIQGRDLLRTVRDDLNFLRGTGYEHIAEREIVRREERRSEALNESRPDLTDTLLKMGKLYIKS